MSGHGAQTKTKTPDTRTQSQPQAGRRPGTFVTTPAPANVPGHLLRFARPWADNTCRYIEGDPRKGAQPCGLPALRNKSWCAFHAKEVFIKPGTLAYKIECLRYNMLAKNKRAGREVANWISANWVKDVFGRDEP